MNKQLIIGCSAAAGSGKDVLADIAVKEYGFVRADFSDTLKKELKEEFLDKYNISYDYENLYGTQEDKERIIACYRYKEYPEWFYYFLSKYMIGKTTHSFIFNMRSLMQYYGTEYRRSQDQNYWINKTFDSIKEDRVINASTRFLNEARAIKDRGGYIIKIIRPNSPNISNMKHQSEIESTQIVGDICINNNGTLLEYINHCRYAIEDILNKRL